MTATPLANSSVARPEHELVGQVIADGRYRLEAVVGSGAFGVVYRAQHLALGQTVAIKVVFGDLVRSNPAIAERFKREAQAASMLRHRNTVHVLDFGDDGGRLFIAMEYLEGANLFDRVRVRGALGLEELVDIMAQVLAALGAAHDLGIVHRDVKPENVIVLEAIRDDGSPGCLVKVCDFGIAKINSRDEDEVPRATITGRGEVFGTPEYMSPEQARGERLDARSDVYACGAMLYQLACGDVPFDAETPVGILMRHLTDAPRPPRELVPELPPRLEAIILKALEKDREARYQSVRAMRAEMLALLEDESPPAWLTSSDTLPAFSEAVPTPRSTLPAQHTSLELLGSDPDEPAPHGRAPRLASLLVFAAVAAVVVAVVLTLLLGGQAGEEGAGPRLADAGAAPAPSTPTEPPQAAPQATVAAVPPAPPAAPTPSAPRSPAPRIVGAAVSASVQPALFAAVPLAEASPQPSPRAARGADSRTRAATTTRSSKTTDEAPPEPRAAVEPVPDAADAPAAALVPPAAPESPGGSLAVTDLDESPASPAEDPRAADPAPSARETPPPARTGSLRADVSVGSVSVKGSLPRTVVARALDDSVAELEACYASAASSAGRDEESELEMVVAFEIDVDGWAGNVRVGQGGLPGLRGCVADVVGRLRTRDRPDTGTVLAGARLRFAPR